MYNVLDRSRYEKIRRIYAKISLKKKKPSRSVVPSIIKALSTMSRNQVSQTRRTSDCDEVVRYISNVHARAGQRKHGGNTHRDGVGEERAQDSQV